MSIASTDAAVRSTCVSHSKMRVPRLHVRAVVYAPDGNESKNSLDVSAEGEAAPSMATAKRCSAAMVVGTAVDIESARVQARESEQASEEHSFLDISACHHGAPTVRVTC